MEDSFGMECTVQRPQFTITEERLEGYYGDGSVLNSSVCDLSDEEVSTKKEKHMRLGPEDLNDTLLYEL